MSHHLFMYYVVILKRNVKVSFVNMACRIIQYSNILTAFQMNFIYNI